MSAGLNQKKLSLWCRQIVKCGSLVDEFYQPWSCVVKTGMFFSRNLCFAREWTISHNRQTFDLGKRTKYFTTARQRILRLAELQSFVAKCCKIQKI